MDLRNDAEKIISGAIKDVLPGKGVFDALRDFHEKAYFIAIGKAAWEMGNACALHLKENLIKGIVITKYGHSRGPIENTDIYEAGHPILDENGIKATEKAVEMAKELKEGDHLIFLISGGGSSLFEIPEKGLSIKDIEIITQKLLACGADITEMNTIRKRLSAVKGGKFAMTCPKANIYAVILSDVLGDNPEFIASGPVSPDSSTYEDVAAIIDKYNLDFDSKIMPYLKAETPKNIENVKINITGSVTKLCQSASEHARSLGYRTSIMTSTLDCEAYEAGILISSMAIHIKKCCEGMLPCALIFGGETVVKLKGKGKGGRNQEIAISAAQGLENMENVLVFSVGSDGTDGPTDAAGGMADGTTVERLKEIGLSVKDVLDNNDSYNALKAIGDLIITGPTGTNVNDIAVLLMK